MAGRILGICFACCRSIPVVFISAIIVWSYYAYVFQMCFFSVESYIEKGVYLIIYHPALAMMAWSYWKTIFTSVSVPPKQFKLSRPDLDMLNGDLTQSERREVLLNAGRCLPTQCRTLTGEMRYCEKCKAIKPDRAHHCSICGRCILKMDHHCPWVNNCVCFSNYKFFVLFLAYALIYCLYVAVTSLQYFITFWTSITPSHGNTKSNLSSLHVVFLFFAALMFGISLISLSGYHWYLIAKNRTTLEAFQTPIFTTGPDKNGYNLGAYRNFVYVFGSNKKYWFLPIHSSYGDGLTYPLNSCNSDEAHDSLLGRRQRWAEEGENDDDDSDTHIFDRNSLQSS